MDKPTLNHKHLVMRMLLYIEWFGLFIITLLTILLIGQEIQYLLSERRIALHDILLLFIYLEVLTMVALYYTSGKLPVRYPIYIAIVSIARYIILNMKEMEPVSIIYLSLAILILVIAVLVQKVCQTKFSSDQEDLTAINSGVP